MRTTTGQTWLTIAGLLLGIGSAAVARTIYVSADARAGSGAIMIDHNCVDLSAVPDEYLAPAASLRMLMRHASVGDGINWGLECLAGSKPTQSICAGFSPGKYDRSNWHLENRGNPGSKAKVDDLVTQAESRAGDFDVFMMKFCYIDALGSNQPDWQYYRNRMEQLDADYPDKVFVWWTIPLTRDGQSGTDLFNAQVRAYCAANGKALFDIAGIECHDPNGAKLTNAAGNEVISQNYTKEIHAGHLNRPGRVRVASALWHLMARLAGWQERPNTIQAAIDAAEHGDVVIVKPGMYTGDGNRDIDFKGKAITMRSQNGPENCIIDCNATETEPHRGFVFDSAEDANSVLDGFTITNGYAEYGGAVLIDSASPTISGCTLTANTARRGGAIRCHVGSPHIVDCNITSNIASAGDGGAIDIWEGYPVVSRCVLTENTAWSAGGAICYGGNQDPTISYCTILRNSATMGGGIMLGVGSATTRAKIDGCTISGNRAADRYYAGGIQLMGAGFTRSSTENGSITNCIVTGNSAGIAIQGGSWTIANCTIAANTYTGIEYDASNNSLLANTILWNNELQLSVLTSVIGGPSSAYVIVSNSNIEGGLGEVQVGPVGSILEWKDSNTGLEPRFAGPGRWDPNGTLDNPTDDFWIDGDYHLKSQAGRWDANERRWMRDEVTSPCIDAGDPASPIGQEPFPNGGIVNMGAYGGTGEASKSYFGEPVCETIVAGDINGDCKVDFADLTLMAAHWLSENR